MAGSAKVPKISDAEWAVMALLWERHPRTASDLAAALEGPTGWKPATVKTLLTRLVEKGAVRFRKDGKQYLYSPAVEQSRCVRAESRSFLDRVFGGAVAPMLAHFVGERELTPEQIAELRRVLDRAEKGDKP